MENFYKDMTYLAVYDGHGTFGRLASDLVNTSIREHLEENKEALYKIDDEDEMRRFFQDMYAGVQKKFRVDVFSLSASSGDRRTTTS
ncbi:MAG: hypothetical protein P4M11_08185 [Candidatus Pacebacteria bacterium]|nr:hypothetical protein [Candidatus Paceibacterota bacterium]